MKETNAKNKQNEQEVPLESLFEQLTNHHRLREDFIKARMTAKKQMEAMVKKSKNMPEESKPDQYMGSISSGFDQFKIVEKVYEKEMVKIAKQMPLHDWFTKTNGCGTISLGILLAETGDLSNYANPAKVWKRMGLSVRDGEAEKNKTKGENTGYSKRRRMISHRISSTVVMKKSHYQDIYKERKKYELERDEKGYNKLFVEANRASMLKHYTAKSNQERIKNNQMPLFVLDLRAHRYMVKRLISDLWGEWTKQRGINN